MYTFIKGVNFANVTRSRLVYFVMLAPELCMGFACDDTTCEPHLPSTVDYRFSVYVLFVASTYVHRGTLVKEIEGYGFIAKAIGFRNIGYESDSNNRRFRFVKFLIGWTDPEKRIVVRNAAVPVYGGFGISFTSAV